MTRWRVVALAMLLAVPVSTGCGNDEASEGSPSDETPDASKADGSKSDASENEADGGDKTEPSCSVCDSKAKCSLAGGEATCTCPTGYTGDGTAAGTGCSDVDECSSAGACVDGADCANTVGGFTCSCPSGYTGDGKTSGTGCTDVDECAGANDCVADGAGGSCTNTPGGHTCGCKTGYTGDGLTAGSACTDVDECAGANDCVATGSGGSCANSTGSYTCSCASPLTGDGTKSGTGCRSVPELMWYRFNGVGATVPNFASAPPAGTENATLVGNVTQGNTGQCGGALVGTGESSTTSYVDTHWATNLTASWTIAFWTADVPSTTSTQYILGDVNAGSLRVFTGGVAGAGNWILRGPLTDVSIPNGASAAPSQTTLVYDSAANEIRAYLNGTLVNTVAQAGVVAFGSGPFKVGAYSSSASLPAGSRMDEFRLYNRALSAAEISTLSVTPGVCQ